MPPIPLHLNASPDSLPPTIEELIALKRKAGQTTSAQFKSPLAVEFTSLLPVEVAMWQEAIEHSNKGKYIALIEADGHWVVMWNADRFPSSIE